MWLILDGSVRHALSSQPVRVRIDDVYLLAAPRDSANSTPEEDAARAQAAKMEKLENAELLSTQSSPTMSAEEEKKNQSFIESLTSKVTSNLQLEVSPADPLLPEVTASSDRVPLHLYSDQKPPHPVRRQDLGAWSPILGRSHPLELLDDLDRL